MTENQVSRRNFLRKAVPVIAGVGLAGALGIDRTFGALTTTSTANSTGPGTTPGTPLATASYVIAQEKNCEAQNGTTGKIDFSGTDATQVIQSAMNALPSGGLIFLRKGIYQTTGTIAVGQGIHLLGEQGAALKVGDGAQSLANPFNILEVMGDNVTIENLEFDGNASSNPNIAGNTTNPAPANPNIQCGILVRVGQNAEIQNCYVHSTWNAGIWLAASDGDVQGSEISSCLIEDTGLSYSDASSANPPQSSNAIYVFRLSGSTSNSNIHDNMISNTYGRGIYLHFDSNSTISDNTLSSERPYTVETSGIILDDFVQCVIVRGNRISGYSPGICVVWRGCEHILIEGNSCVDAPNTGGAGSGICVVNTNAGSPILKGMIVKGNICRGNALTGISIAASDMIVEGNICYNNNRDSQDPEPRRAGILVEGDPSASVDGVLIIGNRCFDNQDQPTQAYGVSLSQQGATISEVLVANNDLRGNGIGSIGALDSQSFKLHNNLGYNPLGIEPISVGSSPFTYVNSDGVSEAIYIAGGIVLGISKNNNLVFTSSPATIWLDPGDSLTITHQDPPKILKDRR